MQVIEHQYLQYKNVLTFKTKIDNTPISDFINRISENINVLNLKQNGKIVFTQKSSYTEFIIPIDREIVSNEFYKFKSVFKFVNALRIRHYGSFEKIGNKVEILNKYIKLHSLYPITQPYFIVQDCENEIYDVYIGISENVL